MFFDADFEREVVFQQARCGAAEDAEVRVRDGDELRYDARTATGVLYEAFTLKRRDGQPNELVERVPAGVEERLGE